MAEEDRVQEMKVEKHAFAEFAGICEVLHQNGMV